MARNNKSAGGWADQSFAEYMSFVSGGEDDFTKLFTNRLSDGDLSDSDFTRIQKKTGYDDKQINRLSEKFINELSNPNYYGSPASSPAPSPVPSPTSSPISDPPPVMGPLPPPDFEAPTPTPVPTSSPIYEGPANYTYTPPSRTPTPTPAPTPAPTPSRYTPEPAFDAEAFTTALNDALAAQNAANLATIQGITAGYEGQLGDLASSYESRIGDLTSSYEGRIGDLTSSFGSQIAGLQSSLADQNAAYQGQIEALQGTIAGNQSTLNNYAAQISSLGDQLREAEKNARQVKVTDTSYIGDNTASGVRLNRSNNFRRSAFALGTGQLNRDNRQNLFTISNVNL